MSVLETKKFEFKGGMKAGSLAFILVGIIATIVSFMMNPTVAWVDYLVNSLYFVTVSVSGIFFLSITGVLQASWLAPYKRVPEAMIQFLPIAFLLMLATYFGLHTIYEWTHTELVANDPILSQKTAWLNVGGFMMRMVIIFAIWMFLAWKLRSLSNANNGSNTEEVAKKTVGFSAVSLILFSFSICFAAFDWIMSIEPHWFSTIFGVYVFAGSFVSGISFVTIAVIKLRDWGYFKNIINENHLHDLGKWMFGMSTFWAYIWLSQYLLIWYANIPEETEYYVLRSHHGWGTWFWFNLIINWTLPFFLLMTRESKRNTKRLLIVAVMLLAGHFLDLYLMVAPMIFHHNDAHITGYGALQVLQWLGFAGLFLFVVARSFSKREIVANHDPNLMEGIHLHQ